MKANTIAKANRLTEEIIVLRKSFNYFNAPYSRMSVVNERERKSIMDKVKTFALEATGLKEMRLNACGWFGGETCTVDLEFVQYCAEYYRVKLADKEKELEDLQE